MSNGRAFKKSRAATKAMQAHRKQQRRAGRGFQAAFSAAAQVVTSRTNGMSSSIDADSMWPGALTVLAAGDTVDAAGDGEVLFTSMESLDPTPEDILEVAKEYVDADPDRS